MALASTSNTLGWGICSANDCSYVSALETCQVASDCPVSCSIAAAIARSRRWAVVAGSMTSESMQNPCCCSCPSATPSSAVGVTPRA